MPEIDFKEEVKKSLNDLVAGLAPGSAELAMGADLTDEVHFTITPSNVQAAGVRGVFGGDVLSGAGIQVAVGHASQREIWIPKRRPDKCVAAVDLLCRICRAVVAGNFSEKVEYLGKHQIARAELILNVGGSDLHFDYGFLFHNPFRRVRREIFKYEPYA